MAYKMLISKPGIDALGTAAQDPQNLILDSELNHIKTAGSGTVTLSASAGGTQLSTVNHSLTYQPLVLAYYHNVATNSDRWLITSSVIPSTGISRIASNDSVACLSGTASIGFLYKNQSGSAGTVELLYEYFYEGSP